MTSWTQPDVPSLVQSNPASTLMGPFQSSLLWIILSLTRTQIGIAVVHLILFHSTCKHLYFFASKFVFFSTATTALFLGKKSFLQLISSSRISKLTISKCHPALISSLQLWFYSWSRWLFAPPSPFLLLSDDHQLFELSNLRTHFLQLAIPSFPLLERYMFGIFPQWHLFCQLWCLILVFFFKS